MSDASTQAKTPARRRHGRNQNKETQKAYASENDIGTFDNGACYSPQTPEHGSSAIVAHRNAHSSQSARRRSAQHPRGKRTPVPLESGPQAAGNTPPQKPTIVRPGTETAYAGATFSSRSPAASALRIPSFISKASRPFTASLQPSPPATDTDAPTPQRVPPSRDADDSPLDFMFRAHREEKDRQRRESSGGQKPSNLADTVPTSQPPLRHPYLDQNQYFSTRPALQHRSHSGFDGAELDASSHLPTGPAFATPYHERINAARTSFAPQNRPNSTAARPQTASDDSTEALKKFLFSGGSAPANVPPSPPTLASSRPGVCQAAADPTHRRNIEAMENDLRRILKMNLGSVPKEQRFVTR